jgi:hypothetical protein
LAEIAPAHDRTAGVLVNNYVNGFRDIAICACRGVSGAKCRFNLGIAVPIPFGVINICFRVNIHRRGAMKIGIIFDLYYAITGRRAAAAADSAGRSTGPDFRIIPAHGAQGKSLPLRVFIDFPVAVVIQTVAGGIRGLGPDGFCAGPGDPDPLLAVLNLGSADRLRAVGQLGSSQGLGLAIHAVDTSLGILVIDPAVAVIVKAVAAFFNDRIDAFAAAPLHIGQAHLLLIGADRRGIHFLSNNAGSRRTGPAIIHSRTVAEIGIVLYSVAVIINTISALFDLHANWKVIVASSTCAG